MDGDKSSIMVMEPPSPQCVGEFFSSHFALFLSNFFYSNIYGFICSQIMLQGGNTRMQLCCAELIICSCFCCSTMYYVLCLKWYCDPCTMYDACMQTMANLFINL